MNPPDSQATSTAVFHFVFSMQGNGIVRLRNGTTGFIRWHPGFPNAQSARTKMMIFVNFKPERGDSGMFNIQPSNTRYNVPLCEIILV